MVSDAVRQIVLERDNFMCQTCETLGSRANPLTMHHIRFKSQGGNSTPENLITWCRTCHSAFHKVWDSQHKSRRKHRSKKRRRR